MAETFGCPACKGDLAHGSRFCPHCGVALAQSGTAELFRQRPSPDTRELLKSHLARPRRSIHEAYRRPLGAQPAVFLGALSLVALILGLILLITGPWISAIIALAVFIGLSALFMPAARHDPHSQAARMTRRGVNSATSVARFVAVAARAWAQAAVSLVHVKQRRLRLRRELHSKLTPLGEAVHRGDEARAQQLKAQADKLEQRLTEIDNDASTIVEDARETVEREKASSQSTQSLPAIQPEIDLSEGKQQHAPDGPGRRSGTPYRPATGAPP